jgi:hypothetical protein
MIEDRWIRSKEKLIWPKPQYETGLGQTKTMVFGDRKSRYHGVVMK